MITIRRAAHASPVAIALLVGANLVPLVGVLFLGWDLATLVALYWLENGVVGIFAIGRILSAQGSGPLAFVGGSGGLSAPAPRLPSATALSATTPARVMAIIARLIMVPFFIVHYGAFWAAHGVFVWFALPFMFADFGAPMSMPDVSVVLAAGVAILVSHGASFAFNWLGAGECRTSTPGAEMVAPYVRVLVLQVTIVLGAFAVVILGAPVWALVVMVGVKLATDLAAHLAERRRAAARLGPEVS